jgi:hypothetical protein
MFYSYEAKFLKDHDKKYGGDYALDSHRENECNFYGDPEHHLEGDIDEQIEIEGGVWFGSAFVTTGAEFKEISKQTYNEMSRL